jgi:arylsulfatase A-like enzyme
MVPSASPVEAANDPEPRGEQPILSAVAWVAVGAAAWWIVLLGETLTAGLQVSTSMIVALAGNSLRITSLLAIPLGLLHALARGLRNRNRRWLGWTALGAALLGVWPAFHLAGFLCSGDWISSQWWSPVLHGLLGSALVGGIGLTWFWHVLTLPAARRSLSTGIGKTGALARSRFAAVALPLAGIGAAFGSLLLLRPLFATYSLLADTHAIFTWMVVATAANAAVARERSSARTKAVLATVVIILGASASVSARWDPRPLPAGSGNLMHFTIAAMAGSGNPAVRFDISDPSVFECAIPTGDTTMPAARMPETRHRNVILVSIESLRLDHLGKQIRGIPVTPHLSSFASGAQDFRRAHTTFPATLFALTSAFTGYYPSSALFSPQPPESITTRARNRFDEFHLLLPDDYWFDLPALSDWVFQGASPSRHPNAEAQTRRALEILVKAREHDASVFLWLHYYEPHQPYRRHADFDFGANAELAYASEVAFVDDQFGRLAEHLERHGWLEDSLVAVFADHGQALGERGYFGHHVYLTRPLTAIPFLLRYPGSRAGPRESLVSIADIAPTVLHYLGLPMPTDLDGASLLLPGGTGERNHLVAEAFPLRGQQLFDFAARVRGDLDGLRRKIAVVQINPGSYPPKVALIDRTHRLIVDRVSGAIELYDDEADPHNDTNLSGSRPQLAEKMMSTLIDWHFEVSRRTYCAAIGSAPGSN